MTDNLPISFTLAFFFAFLLILFILFYLCCRRYITSSDEFSSQSMVPIIATTFTPAKDVPPAYETVFVPLDPSGLPSYDVAVASKI